MANYANTAAGMLAAETRAKTLVANRTWLYAHSGHDNAGNTVIRFVRFMAKEPTSDKGGWVETRDDTVV